MPTIRDDLRHAGEPPDRQGKHMALSFAGPLWQLFRDVPNLEAIKGDGFDLSSDARASREGAGDLRDPGRWQHAVRRTLDERTKDNGVLFKRWIVKAWLAEVALRAPRQCRQ
jgi:hypothetical protein